MRISDWSSDVCSSDLSKVSVSRVAAPPHCGQTHLRHSGSALIGDFTPVNATSSGSTTGNWSSGTGTASHLSQRSEEHTSELQSLMRISYAVFCLKKKKPRIQRRELVTTSTKITPYQTT